MARTRSRRADRGNPGAKRGPAEGSAAEIDLRPDPERSLQFLTLGERIAIARHGRGLTQKQLSERVGKSRATIVQYEQGRLQPPLDQIKVIAKALEVAPELIAFGLQGISGLAGEAANVSSVAELELAGDEVVTSGAYGLATTLVDHLGIEPGEARVYVLAQGAPAFGLGAGDRLIVNAATELSQEGRLYALRSAQGVTVARLLPSLTASHRVNLNGAYGETIEQDPRDLELLGLVVGSIQAR